MVQIIKSWPVAEFCIDTNLSTGFKKINKLLRNGHELKCAYCGKEAVKVGLYDSGPKNPVAYGYFTRDNIQLTIDHVIARSHGGCNSTVKNCVIACKKCNARKAMHEDPTYAFNIGKLACDKKSGRRYGVIEDIVVIAGVPYYVINSKNIRVKGTGVLDQLTIKEKILIFLSSWVPK